MIKLINGDCQKIMSEYPDKYFDLAIADPPYGINIETSGTYFKKFKTNGWDHSIPDKSYFDELQRISVNQIIWGGNYFLHYLGSTKCFLIWDKMIGEGMSFADAELAWTSFDKPIRIKKLLSRSENGKIHPCEKPPILYKWLLKNYAKPEFKLLDTHGGSMSSVIAGIDFEIAEMVCTEIDPDYYKDGVKRVMNHVAQLNMYVKPPEIIFK